MKYASNSVIGPRTRGLRWRRLTWLPQYRLSWPTSRTIKFSINHLYVYIRRAISRYTLASCDRRNFPLIPISFLSFQVFQQPTNRRASDSAVGYTVRWWAPFPHRFSYDPAATFWSHESWSFPSRFQRTPRCRLAHSLTLLEGRQGGPHGRQTCYKPHLCLPLNAFSRLILLGMALIQDSMRSIVNCWSTASNRRLAELSPRLERCRMVALGLSQ